MITKSKPTGNSYGNVLVAAVSGAVVASKIATDSSSLLAGVSPPLGVACSVTYGFGEDWFGETSRVDP